MTDLKIVRFGKRGAAVHGGASVAPVGGTPIILGPNRTQPWLTATTLVFSDIAALLLAWAVAFTIRDAFGGALYLEHYIKLWPALLLFVFGNSIAGMYPGTNFLPPEEIRRLSYTTTLVFLVLAVSLFLSKGSDQYSRVTFVSSWLLALILVPLSRKIVRTLFLARGWWGQAIAILGAGKTGEMVINMMREWPGIGLKPIVVLDDDPGKHGELSGVPVVGPLDIAPDIAKKLGIRRAVIAMPGVDRRRLLRLVEHHSHSFPHLLVVPDLFGFSSLWVDARDLGGVLGLEIRQNLMMKRARATKRTSDILLTLLSAIAVLPLALLISTLIKLTSRGPVFFGQERVGRDGQRFIAWKFRSMCCNAEQVLEDYLCNHPEAKSEWDRFQKLRDDPRVTWIGSILRRTSLDELPQLWNVLRGDMSLVGPRPMFASQVPLYGEHFELYSKVRPGLSGLWQVSGRNETTFAKRVMLDAYYVRNWSVWLDIYILARTVKVVLGGKGAY